jgi:hypothetical protein
LSAARSLLQLPLLGRDSAPMPNSISFVSVARCTTNARSHSTSTTWKRRVERSFLASKLACWHPLSCALFESLR